jgi:hypothetical protein
MSMIDDDRPAWVEDLVTSLEEISVRVDGIAARLDALSDGIARVADAIGVDDEPEAGTLPA